MERTKFNEAIKSSLIIELVTIIMVIIFAYIMIFYMRGLDIVTDSEAQGHINNTTDQWVVIVGVIIFAVVLSILLTVLFVLKNKGK